MKHQKPFKRLHREYSFGFAFLSCVPVLHFYFIFLLLFPLRHHPQQQQQQQRQHKCLFFFVKFIARNFHCWTWLSLSLLAPFLSFSVRRPTSIGRDPRIRDWERVLVISKGLPSARPRRVCLCVYSRIHWAETRGPNPQRKWPRDSPTTTRWSSHYTRAVINHHQVYVTMGNPKKHTHTQMIFVASGRRIPVRIVTVCCGRTISSCCLFFFFLAMSSYNKWGNIIYMDLFIGGA